MADGNRTKTQVAAELGIARSSLYYKKKIPKKDELLTLEIHRTLHLHPGYGHRRIAKHLGMNKKRIKRVMKVAGIQPYRRHGKKPKYAKNTSTASYPNLIKGWFPERTGSVWISDFTYLPFHGRWVFLATILDLYSREVLGWHVSTSHDAAHTAAALFHALTNHRAPGILHSDHGKEYTAKSYTELAERFGIRISMSKKASPRENGYQESFFSRFKVDLGDPERFNTLGELTEYIYLTIYIYNTYRIHSAHGMSPREFLKRMQPALMV